jgi:ribonuclease HII
MAKAAKLPSLAFERATSGLVAGIDEAGCAPLAGPVVAAAVVLPAWSRKPRRLHGLTDSKLLPEPERERLYRAIVTVARIGIGAASAAEIDRVNIYNADMLAMRRAVAALGFELDLALVDGNRAPKLACRVQTIVKGDSRSLSIAAASVVAKVTRDRLMARLAGRYPGYGWQTNRGYGTDDHYVGLLRFGPTRHHRLSFAPLCTLFCKTEFGVRFAALTKPVDPLGVRLIRLREDLHVVCDRGGCHLGLVKWTTGKWVLKAVGYDDGGNALPGGGPLTAFHNRVVAGPDPESLSSVLGVR